MFLAGYFRATDDACFAPSLYGCDIPDCTAIAAALKENKSLITLRMNDDAITDCRPLMEALKTNTTLRRLEYVAFSLSDLRSHINAL